MNGVHLHIRIFDLWFRMACILGADHHTFFRHVSSTLARLVLAAMTMMGIHFYLGSPTIKASSNYSTFLGWARCRAERPRAATRRLRRLDATVRLLAVASHDGEGAVKLPEDV